VLNPATHLRTANEGGALELLRQWQKNKMPFLGKDADSDGISGDDIVVGISRFTRLSVPIKATLIPLFQRSSTPRKMIVLARKASLRTFHLHRPTTDFNEIDDLTE
jgi:hypothetical protein